MISVVCVYNNEKILNNYLLKSLNSQTANYELITLDNTKGKFKSAAEALNHGGKQAKGKYIMFIHQDVDLCSNTWLEEVEKDLDNLPNLGVAGVAGMSDRGNNNKERGRNIIRHGSPATTWSWGNPIQKPEPVQTVDECLLLIPKSVFNILQFDEDTCDSWHLYGVDYCLSCKRLGFEVLVIPRSIYHRSMGSLTRSYYLALKKIFKKNKIEFKRIYTTCGDWSTSSPLTLQRVLNLAKAAVEVLSKKGEK